LSQLSVDGNKGPTPGSPLALANTYLANCQLNAQLYEGSENGDAPFIDKNESKVTFLFDFLCFLERDIQKRPSCFY
jgi:hypothetical protein